MNYYDNFETFEYDTYNIVSGWLDTKGVLHKCGWGQHTELAYDLIREYNYEDEYDMDEQATSTENCREWLIRKKNWILLDNPTHNKKTQVIIYNPLKKKTKDQLKRMLDLFEQYIGIQKFIMGEMQ